MPSTPNPATDPAAPDPQTAPDDSAQAAETCVRRYYRAINAKDYESAYALWGNQGASSRQTYAAFANGYAKTLKMDARIGTASAVEGAAGSRYIQVPVELAATHADGSTRHYRGTVTLRLLAADGATPEQRRWHLDSLDLEGYEPAGSTVKTMQ